MRAQILLLIISLVGIFSCKKDPVVRSDEYVTQKPFDTYRFSGDYSGEETLIQEHWHYEGVILADPWSNKTSWDYTYDSSEYDATGTVTSDKQSEVTLDASAVPAVYPLFSETFIMDSVFFETADFDVHFVGENGDSLYVNAITIHEDAFENMISNTAEYNCHRFEARFALIRN